MNNESALKYPFPMMITLLIFSGWLLYGLGLAGLFVIVSAVAWFAPAVLMAGLWAIGLLVALGAVFTVIMAISAVKRGELIDFIPTRNIWMKYFVPVARSISKRIGLSPDRVVWSYIKLSNDFIMNAIKDKQISNIMILLPHCLQLQSCGLKLTSNVRNCKKCGKCVVNSLIELSDKLAVDIFVASGGTMARKHIFTNKPDMLLAVACERDLLSGIRDTLPMPVIGVINERPEGPCVNTTVDTEQITSLINRIKK